MEMAADTSSPVVMPRLSLRALDALALAMLAVCGAVCFHQVIWFGYLPWDDYENITRNPNLHGNLGRGLLNIWTHAYDGLYIPLTYTSWWFKRLVHASAVWCHAANLILHILTGLCVYLLCKAALQESRWNFVAA